MNILFCTSYRVSEQKGGTERITARIAQGLRKQGHRCFSAYKEDIEKGMTLSEWDGEMNASFESIEEFILDNQIDIVIIQKMTRDVKIFNDIRKRNELNLIIISVLHFNPGYEEQKMTWSAAKSSWRYAINFQERIKASVRCGLYPIYKIFYPLRNKELYRTVYHYSDKVVLLSNRFISEFQSYAGLHDVSKFEVIPNALSYNCYFDPRRMLEKNKTVLIVSRLDEIQKRISLAIRIWAEIEKDPSLNDWSLIIVGHGDAEIDYRQLICKLKLERVALVGRHEPRPYYENSSIFMLTSAFEGWGLTLTEAQQFGCVPIAFDSFSSLNDIITDGENGFIVKNNCISEYVQKLKYLMVNESLRIKMAKEAISSSFRFELPRVLKAWISILS